jgi:hypothetical protein
MHTTTQDETPAALMKAVAWLCRPLVRLLIEKGIGYPQLRDLFKRLYVDVAEESFALDGKPPTDSRLYILTGVHRKDIKRLRAAAEDDTAAQASTLGAAVVSHWLGLPEYRDADGTPRCLPRTASEDQPCFDALVAEVSKDVRPRAILDELLRQGVASINEAGEICLQQAAFVPTADFGEQVFFMGRNVHDHLAACTHNLLTPDAPMLERSVYFARLSESSARQLRELAERQSTDLLNTINEKALALQKDDTDHPDANHRIRFGCYWYQAQRATDKGKKS